MLTYALWPYRGDTFRRRFVLWADAAKTTAADLTGATVAAEIRSAPGATPITTIACSVTLPNTIDLVLTPAVSSGLAASGFWDLQITYASGDVQTIVSGAVKPQGDITQSVAPTAARGIAHA